MRNSDQWGETLNLTAEEQRGKNSKQVHKRLRKQPVICMASERSVNSDAARAADIVTF